MTPAVAQTIASNGGSFTVHFKQQDKVLLKNRY
jgi:hypothetical protein